tara:strand:+ start:6036 stop:6617 length:582 start_codon:yes stop_codon:yes gene_type:complete
MSRTKNEERLEILNKRLAEINQKQINPSKTIEADAKNIENFTNVKEQYPKKTNKFRRYLFIIAIIFTGFLILKNLDLGSLISFNSADEKNSTKKTEESEIKNDPLKYNFTLKKNEFIIVFSEFDNKDEAIKIKESKSKDFVEFDINYFFLPNKSNSKEKVYKLFAGPINGSGAAKHWYNIISEIDPKAEIIPK